MKDRVLFTWEATGTWYKYWEGPCLVQHYRLPFVVGFTVSVNFFHIVYVLSHWVVSNSLQPHGLYPARLLCPWGFSRQEYWGGFLCPSSGDLLNSSDRIEVSKHCRWIPYHLSYHIESNTVADIFCLTPCTASTPVKSLCQRFISTWPHQNSEMSANAPRDAHPSSSSYSTKL